MNSLFKIFKVSKAKCLCLMILMRLLVAQVWCLNKAIQGH
ncbi:hypothetical protein SaSA201_0561 [Streptococcus agalactiae]|nr:hypothetical protein A964_0652 [Streptococcus agalactiae GD201008-001]AFV72022.1 hypothetical protein SaSA20_0549 [Streptococcus agalactiae]EFV97055.1 hypothetical protein HMPREF9171_1434 [Streptococcus agalactiae ATCC 13813]CCW37515.1 hypothetical protein BSA_7430 [Streptococcus agalactiae 09mas018883]AKI95079.1 Hypothetical protein RDF_0664 [Streptococcus agalactiae]